MGIKILDWIINHKLMANVIGKGVITALLATLMYFIINYPLILIIIDGICIAGLIAVLHVLWNADIDLFYKLDEKVEEDNHKNK